MGIWNNLLKLKKRGNAKNKIVQPDKTMKKLDDAIVDREEQGTIITQNQHNPNKKKEVDPTAYKVISHPLISEKATDLAGLNKYIFIVPVSANKAEVKKKIQTIYGVKPVKVNIIYSAGKVVQRGRYFGKKKNFKKAIITLAAGQKIDVYAGV